MTGPIKVSEDEMSDLGTPAHLPARDVPRECRRRRKGVGWVWKHRYATEASARLNLPHGSAVYQCGFCGYWHTGKMNDPAIGSLANRIHRALRDNEADR